GLENLDGVYPMKTVFASRTEPAMAILEEHYGLPAFGLDILTYGSQELLEGLETSCGWLAPIGPRHQVG
ncbi:MAG: hypothetical protein KJ922_05095, partial [Nanoarchaeota archaeon]|nr:hypothetical protein [Nanoarchaeota archaeon]